MKVNLDEYVHKTNNSGILINFTHSNLFNFIISSFVQELVCLLRRIIFWSISVISFFTTATATTAATAAHHTTRTSINFLLNFWVFLRNIWRGFNALIQCFGSTFRSLITQLTQLARIFTEKEVTTKTASQ